jgi:hypothetical protein
MTESKIALTERLRREGRWAEASKFKDAAVADFRANGMTRAEANEAAWTATAERFPPPSPEETLAESVAGTGKVSPTNVTPIPWHDLPTEPSFNDEVRWVHQQYIVIIEESPRGRIIHWDRATTKPPSTGACALASWAAENRTAFYKDLLPKTMAKAGAYQEDDERIQLEKVRSIEELERYLVQIQDIIDAELRDNVPMVLQRRVRDMLANWLRRHAVSLSDEARAQLDSDICRLIQDSLRAFASS